jgi:hypothetical protein
MVSGHGVNSAIGTYWILPESRCETACCHVLSPSLGPMSRMLAFGQDCGKEKRRGKEYLFVLGIHSIRGTT